MGKSENSGRRPPWPSGQGSALLIIRSSHRCDWCRFESRTHGGEACDLKLEIPGTPPTVRICISLIFSLIMVGCAWVFLQTI